jgi:hypothetical protein
MKKFFAVVALVVLAGLAPAAAQTGNVAIGPIYSLNMFGLSSPLGGLGVTGKIPGLAPIMGLNFSLSNQDKRYFVGYTADWLLYKEPLYAPFNLNFYLGPGFYTSALLEPNNDRIDLGLRIPVGINWVPVRFFEIFAEVTPAFGVTFRDPVAPSWLIQSALGARVWF